MSQPSNPFILGRQVELLYRNVRLGQIVSIVNASFLVWIAQPLVARNSLAIWWLLAVSMAGLRMAMAAHFHGRFLRNMNCTRAFIIRRVR